MANYNQVNISSGHSVNCRGASGVFDEVTEAIKVVNKVSEMLKSVGVPCYTYHDKSSDSYQNLVNIANWHNQFKDGIDVSIHFNASNPTNASMGVEVLYYSQSGLASEVSSAIANAGNLKNRGAKQRTGLYFLRHTNKPAILIEVCFCDSSYDANKYRSNFNSICAAIVKALTGKSVGHTPTSNTSASSTSNSCNPHIRDWQGAFSSDFYKIGIDGIVGPETQAAMKKAVLKVGSRGNLVAWLQCRVGADIDGIFGNGTKSKVVEFQKNHGLDVDGIAGYNTWSKLFDVYK